MNLSMSIMDYLKGFEASLVISALQHQLEQRKRKLYFIPAQPVYP